MKCYTCVFGLSSVMSLSFMGLHCTYFRHGNNVVRVVRQCPGASW